MHELLELGGVLIVTFRNSIANFRLFSPTDPSEKPIDQITNSRAIPSVEAATYIKFPYYYCQTSSFL